MKPWMKACQLRGQLQFGCWSGRLHTEIRANVTLLEFTCCTLDRNVLSG